MNTIGLLTPDTPQCLHQVGQYITAIEEPCTILTIETRKLINTISDASRGKPIHITAIPPSDRYSWQSGVEELVQGCQSLLFFIPPATNHKPRLAADRKQAFAQQLAMQRGIPIQRVYVEDTELPRTHHSTTKTDTIQQLPLGGLQQRNPQSASTISTTNIPNLPYPRLPKLPQHWTKANQSHPLQDPNWIAQHITFPITEHLRQHNCQLGKITPPILDTQHQTISHLLIEATYNGIPLLITQANTPTDVKTSLTYLKNHNFNNACLLVCTSAIPQTLPPFKPTKEGVIVIPQLVELQDSLNDYCEWLTFAQNYTLQQQTYYLPRHYTSDTPLSPAKRWEAEHMYPLLAEYMEHHHLPYSSQVPLGQDYADFIIRTNNAAEIIECKRHPFGPNLREAIQQLLTYKALYLALYPSLQSHHITLTLVFPTRTINPQVILYASRYHINIRTITCDERQTDMISKKHLAPRIYSLAQLRTQH